MSSTANPAPTSIVTTSAATSGGSSLATASTSDSVATLTTTTTTATTTTTTVATSSAPAGTGIQFYITFNVPDPTKRSLKRRATVYLAFDADGRSVITYSEAQAAVFYFDAVTGLIKSGEAFVTLDDTVSPPRIALQNGQPSEPLRIGINGPLVTIVGVEKYCLGAQDDLSLITDQDMAAGGSCQSIIPLLDPVSLPLSTTTITSSETSTLAATSISIETITTTDQSSTEGALTTTQTTDSSTAPVTSSTTTVASSTTSSGSIVTDQAYVDTVMRHHNIHVRNLFRRHEAN